MHILGCMYEVEITSGHRSIPVHIAQTTAQNSTEQSLCPDTTLEAMLLAYVLFPATNTIHKVWWFTVYTSATRCLTT
jgi:hypothetical protein